MWGERAFGFPSPTFSFTCEHRACVLLLQRFAGRRLLDAWCTFFRCSSDPADSVATYRQARYLFAFFILRVFIAICYHRNRSSQTLSRHRAACRSLLVLFLAFWALSLMAKEMAASLPILVFVWRLCDGWNEGERSWVRRFWSASRRALRKDGWLYITLALAVPAYAWYAVVLRGGSARAGLSGFDYWGGNFYTNALTAIRVHAWYLKQLVFPTPIVQYSGAFDVATSFRSGELWSRCGGGAVLAIGFFMLDRKRLWLSPYLVLRVVAPSQSDHSAS